MKIFSNSINVFTNVNFDQFNASLFNKRLISLKKTRIEPNLLNDKILILSSCDERQDIISVVSHFGSSAHSVISL